MTRRLAVVHHFVELGGMRRFVDGLLQALIEATAHSGWQITFFSAPRDTAGNPVDWSHLASRGNFRLEMLPDLSRANPRVIERLSEGRRVLGIKGSGVVQRNLARRLAPMAKVHDPMRNAIERVLKESDYDVAYFPYPYRMSCPRITTPLAITIHDFNYKRFETLDPILRIQLDRQTPVWLGKAGRIIVSSNFIAQELRHFHPDSADKATVVRVGIPRAASPPAPKDVRAYLREHNLPKRFLLTTGWIVPHENHGVIFHALAHLRTQGIDVPLVCTGPNSAELKTDVRSSSDYVQEIKDLCREANLKQNRDFFPLGYVSEKDLECLYRLATVLVMPSLYEAGSFSGLEAMLAACPVVFSRIPAHMEHLDLVDHQGWSFEASSPSDLAATIAEVLLDPTEAARRGRGAAALVQQSYSWEKGATGYLSVFESLARTFRSTPKSTR